MADLTEFEIGLCGFGSMGRTHAWAVANLPFFFSSLPFRARMAGLCTGHPEKAKELARTFSIPRVYPDPRAMLEDPDLNLVDLCTPNLTHAGLVRAALESGRAVLCEKPLCVTKEETEALRAFLGRPEAARFGIVFHNRFFSGVLRAKELLEEGALGRILQFRVDYLHDSCTDPQKPAGWKQYGSLGAGVLMDLGSHALDLVTHLLGPTQRLFCREQIAFPERRGLDGKTWTTDGDESDSLYLELKSGACGTVTVSKLATGTQDDLSFYISGTKGALRWNLMDPDFLEFFDATCPDAPLGGRRGFTRIACVSRYPAPGGIFPSPKAPGGWLRAHLQSYCRFLEALAGGTAPTPGLSDALYNMDLLLAAKQSAKEGRMICPGGASS